MLMLSRGPDRPSREWIGPAVTCPGVANANKGEQGSGATDNPLRQTDQSKYGFQL